MLFTAARTALRRTATVAVQRRGYAEAVDATKIKLSLVLPHEVRIGDRLSPVTCRWLILPSARCQAIYTSTEVVQVNLAAASGDMGVLANHVPAVEALKPGVIEVIESAGQSKKWFGEG